VREPDIHAEVIHKVIDYADLVGFAVEGLTYSPIKGPEGNIEYLVFLEKKSELPEEITNLTESDAEGVLKDATAAGGGKSWEEEMQSLISRVVVGAHDALDEAK
jgi:23S rRNA (cytidine1920-2'-O)/16S rRNA (cytidine1409-2'-O)-methyltransferase